MVLFATLHSFAFCFFLIGGNLLILGVNPVKFVKKHREITERIIEKEGLDVDSLSDLFKEPLKKISQSTVNGKTYEDTMKKNV